MTTSSCAIINKVFKGSQILLSCNVILSSKPGKILNKVGWVRMEVRWKYERLKHIMFDSKLKICGQKLRLNKLIRKIHRDGNKR